SSEIDEATVQFLMFFEERGSFHFRFLKAVRVFSRSPRIVIGPIPPGTGEIPDATFDADSKSTSPTVFPFESFAIPTSITTAPGFRWEAPMRRGCPTATKRKSACFVIEARSFVLLWQWSTVAFLWRRSCASGFPTMFDRPTTQAIFPSTE